MSVRAATDFLLGFGVKRNNDPITQLDLQKILYFVEGFHLALREEALFDDEFEAWTNGPVLPSLWRRFRVHGEKPIPKSMTTVRSDIILSTATIDFIEQIWNEYSIYDSGRLVGLTHDRKGPWARVRDNAGIARGEPSEEVIPKEMMAEYFLEIYKQGLEPKQVLARHDAEEYWPSSVVA